MLLATGAAVSTWQALQARAAERRAVSAQRGEAEQRKDAEAVLSFVQDHIFAAARPVDRPGGLGPDVTLRQALDAALPVVERSFVAQPLVEARLRMTLGMSFWYLGDDRTAADQFRRARTIFTDRLGPDHPDTLESMHNLANAYAALGDESEAFQLREETLARRNAKLGPEHVDTLRSRLVLARSYTILNRFDDALELDEQTARLMEAKLGPEHPETLQAMNNLAQDYRHVRRFDDAVTLLEKSLAIQQRTLGRDHLETLGGMIRLANAYNDLGRARQGRPASRGSPGAPEVEAPGRPPRLADEYVHAGQRLRLPQALSRRTQTPPGGAGAAEGQVRPGPSLGALEHLGRDRRSCSNWAAAPKPCP